MSLFYIQACGSPCFRLLQLWLPKEKPPEFYIAQSSGLDWLADKEEKEQESTVEKILAVWPGYGAHHSVCISEIKFRDKHPPNCKSHWDSILVSKG